jgi:hypothetical protein
VVEIFAISQTNQAIITPHRGGVHVRGVLRESHPTEVVALAGVSLLLASGVLPHEDALAVLSNPAPWTIAAMFTHGGVGPYRIVGSR